MFSGKTIFIAPLDWGFGHATRCVPVIRQLSKNNKVIIGITPLNRFFFEQQLPDHQKIMLPSYNVRYSALLPVWLKVLLQWPQINSVIRQEKKLLEELIRQENLEVVISDNRFGLSSKNAHCIFMSHQLVLKTPFLSFLANRANRKFIHRFNEVWVPDYEDKSKRLSGELSDASKIRIPVTYLGPQSYLKEAGEGLMPTAKIDYLVLLSGIEPQRSRLEKLLLDKLKNSGKKIVLVRGSKNTAPAQTQVETIDFLSGAELCQIIVNAETVICRSGYSTLMDLHVLGKKKLVVIPTPGQTEQEYLASYWSREQGATCLLQGNVKDTACLQ